MKKALLLLLAVVSVLQVSAQELGKKDTTQVVSPVDSLSARVNSLQHDYDFLLCKFELQTLIQSLNHMSNSISISAKSIEIYLIHGIYDQGFADSNLDNYNASCDNFEATKRLIETTKLLIMYKLTQSVYSDSEVSVLDAALNSIESSISSVEAALRLYNQSIVLYKGLGK